MKFNHKYLNGFFIVVTLALIFSPLAYLSMRNQDHRTFQFSRCKAELELVDNGHSTSKMAKITLYMFFSDSNVGHLEYTGTVYNGVTTELVRGRQNFSYFYAYNTLQLKNIHKTLSPRDRTQSQNIVLPEYLSINEGDITFSLRNVTPSKVLVTRYDDPIYVMSCVLAK